MIRNLVLLAASSTLIAGCGQPKPEQEIVTPPAQQVASPTQIIDVQIPAFSGCTNDCSGHEAGYEWAQEQGIDDMSDCSGNSQSFIEGCQQYVEENVGHDE